MIKVEGSTSHGLAALKLAMEEIRTIIISMQQEKSGGASDLPMAIPTATNRSRQDRPKKFNFQPWPEINQDIGQLGRFPGDERPSHYFDKYFMKKIEGDLRKMNPFDIEKEVSEKLKGKPSDISSSGRNALLITVTDSSQSQLVQKISIGGQKCEVVGHQHLNKSKGIIYVSEFDVDS